MDRRHGRLVEIPLVEDNPGDVRLTRGALREGGVRNSLYVTRDGEEDLSFLHRRSGYADAPRPNLVPLDLNPPRRDGRELSASSRPMTGPGSSRSWS